MLNIITTEEQLAEFVSAYRNVAAFAFDVETIGEHRILPVINDVCWISFATEDRVDVIPMGHPNGEFLFFKRPLLADGHRRLAEGKKLLESSYSKQQKLWVPIFDEAPEQLTPSQVFTAIKPVMFGSALKIGHNIKFDLKSVAKYFGKKIPAGPYFDTMFAAMIVNNLNKFNLNLQATAKRELGVEIVKGVGEDVSQHAFSEVAKYSGIDSEVTYDLYKALDKKIIPSLRRVWKLEMDVLPALCDMELTGAPIDVEQLDKIAIQIKEDVALAEAKAFRIAGKAFAINAVAAKQEVLFAHRGELPPRIIPNLKLKIALTDRGLTAKKGGLPIDISMYSTAGPALEFYRGKDDLVDALLEYQDLNKLLTTYVIPYKGGDVKRVNKGVEKTTVRESLMIDGRIHSQFKAHGTDTGRVASSNPNLQNIPNPRTIYGRMIRDLFTAPPGHQLVVADYSQIEPRILASLSRDPKLLENYAEGRDIYTTFADPFGINRDGGKVIVLAVSYGVGPDKLASSTGLSMKEAKQVLLEIPKAFPVMSAYKANVIRRAKQSGPVPFVETLFGRRRYIPALTIKAPAWSPNLSEEDRQRRGLLSQAERQAFNTVIQGSAADIMKLAIVRAHSCFLDEPDINVILTVHDELVTITPDDRAEETAEAIRLSMEGISLKEITVPLIADVKIVSTWGSAK